MHSCAAEFLRGDDQLRPEVVSHESVQRQLHRLKFHLVATHEDAEEQFIASRDQWATIVDSLLVGALLNPSRLWVVCGVC